MRRIVSELLRLAKGFGMFWWDFLVGDTPEIFLAVLVILGVVATLTNVAHVNTGAVVVLPILVGTSLVASLAVARRRARR